MSTAGNKRRLRRAAAIALAGATAGGSLLAANAMASAEQTESVDPADVILGAESADAIEGEYLVVLEDQASQDISAMVDDVVADVADTVDVVDEFDVLGGFVAEMSPEEAVELAADDSVAYIEQNRTVTIAATQ